MSCLMQCVVLLQLHVRSFTCDRRFLERPPGAGTAPTDVLWTHILVQKVSSLNLLSVLVHSCADIIRFPPNE